MKRAYRTIAGFLVVIMMVSSFPVLAVTESVWDNDSFTSRQVEKTLEDSATFGDDASDTSSHQSNAISSQEADASIEDVSGSNEESTQQEVLNEEECAQLSFDDAQGKGLDVDMGNEPTGTAISTAEQLQAMGADETSLAGCYYLTCDIDLAQADQLPDDPNNNFTAIGTRSMPFTGSFDGNGHEIQNLQISTKANYQGLFGYIGENALVANVGVTGSVSGKSYVGGIAGYIDKSGSVMNCYNTGKVTGGSNYVGGVAGYIDRSGSVMNCCNTGEVIGSVYSDSVGGVAGEVNNGNVTNCYNIGKVTGRGSYIGGIAGYVDADGSLTNCYNIAEVVGRGYIGCIAGYVYKGSLTNCYYNAENLGQTIKAIGGGTVSDTVKGLTTVQMTGPQALTNMVFTSTEGTWTAARVVKSDQPNAYGDYVYYYPQLTNFVADASDLSQFPQQAVHDFEGTLASVTAYISTADQLQGMNHQPNGNYVLLNDIDLSSANQSPNKNNNFRAIGTSGMPFVGRFDGNGHEVQNLQISTTIDNQGLFGYVGKNSIVTNVGVTGNISGASNVGGVVGYVYAASVTNCYNTAEVTGSGSNIGGAVGCIGSSGSVTNCYNTGNVTGFNENIGGVAGFVEYMAKIENCYSIGKVIGNGSDIGGVAGWTSSDATITNCYYNMDIPDQVPQAIGDRTASDTVKGLTNEQMIGPQALTNMVFTSEEGTWVVSSKEKSDRANAYGDYGYYYPQLTTFVTDASDSSQFFQQTLHSFEGKLAPVTVYISTAEQLQAVNDQLNGNYVLLNDIDLSLADQLPDDQNNNFTAIGTTDAPFVGKFGGNGHEIQNLQISTTNNNQGLFGYIGEDALVTNVGVTGSVSGNERVGSVVGYAYKGSVTDCYNMGQVTAGDSVGGVVGEVANGNVTDCYGAGIVTGSGQYIGGVAGKVYYGTATNCYNKGEVIGGRHVGSVVGLVDKLASVTDCYNTGKATGDGEVGGVAGMVDKESVVTNCYNAGEATGDGEVGGVAGMVDKESVVTNCYNTGTVIGDYYIGGIAGMVDKQGVVTNCYNTGTVTGDYYIGGIVGSMYGNVMSCYNTGTATGGQRVGGIAGYIDRNGSVMNCYSIATVKGSDCVGGLVGDITSEGSIADCYCVGEVTGSSKVGHLVGNASGTVTNCYYNIEFADLSAPDFGVSTGTITNVGAKYTMQMTGSNALGADDMQFSDASAWKTTANTDSLAYYPGISTIETEQPISKPYYNISFDLDSDCTLQVDGFDPNGTVVAGGRYVFTVSREDLSTPMKVLLNGAEIAPIATEGNTSRFMIDNVTAPQQVTVTFVQQVNDLQISGARTMECDTTQTLTLTFDPGNLTTRNKAVTWSVVQGSTGNVTFLEQTADNVVIKATQAGNVTVRATSKMNERVYDNFTITVTPRASSVVFPTQAIVDYGQPLAEATFVGGQGEGTFQFEAQDHVALDEDNGVGYTVIFTPTDAESYQPLKAEVPVTIRLQITDMAISTPVENRNPSTDELLVMKDSYQQFAAQVQGHGLTAENSLVDWSVTGAESPETVIDQTGKLSISRNETAKVLHISITSKGDPTKTAEGKVIVCNPGDFDGTMVVNAMDANLLLHQIQQEIQRAEQPDYLFNPLFNPFYDLNHDNVIDLKDYVEFLKILDGK